MSTLGSLCNLTGSFSFRYEKRDCVLLLQTKGMDFISRPSRSRARSFTHCLRRPESHRQLRAAQCRHFLTPASPPAISISSAEVNVIPAYRLRRRAKRTILATHNNIQTENILIFPKKSITMNQKQRVRTRDQRTSLTPRTVFLPGMERDDARTLAIHEMR
ncbi:hypothetical protein BDV98DRAFT_89131 [Pterulicium gracile]|uniref:Uncharacterized protein n=1 Tax=Pterulicium gracile TaxID=1884261 RepID=A0A5C3QGF3_9AGAR|nr:hypothetical protein BDV98DRAFT_89131 [Pterula gracilis]